MFTTLLYVSLCFSNTDCVATEPQVWTANSVAALNKDLEACAEEERRYMGSESYKESDCYVVTDKS